MQKTHEQSWWRWPGRRNHPKRFDGEQPFSEKMPNDATMSAALCFFRDR
jgi:hypothetical protein